MSQSACPSCEAPLPRPRYELSEVRGEGRWKTVKKVDVSVCGDCGTLVVPGHVPA